MQIYVLQNNEQTGPFTAQELKQHLAAGNLPPDIPAWREGLESWATLIEILRETEVNTAQTGLPSAEPEHTANTMAPLPTASPNSAPVTITVTRATLVWASYGLGTLSAVFLIYYFTSPFYALHALRSAIKAGDADALQTYVDFPTLRESLKEEMKAQATNAMPSAATTTTVTDAQLGPVTITHQETRAPSDTDPFSQVAQALALSMTDSEIDGVVTPAGTLQYLASLGGGTDPSRACLQNRSITPIHVNLDDTPYSSVSK